MLKRTLGKSSLEVSALDMGVNFFDAAANYGAGHSEIVLGKALKGKRATKIPRVYRVLIVRVFVILYGKSQSTEEMCEFVEFLLREN